MKTSASSTTSPTAARRRKASPRPSTSARPGSTAALGIKSLGDLVIEVIDPVTDYAELMQTLFDFPAIAAYAKAGFTLRFDAMHAVTGP